jgi:hypothetical protein
MRARSSFAGLSFAERTMRRLLALALLIASASCSSDSSTNPTAASLPGTWNLSTVNGNPLPFILQTQNPKIEILNDQFIVADGGTFTETWNARFTDASGVVSSAPFSDSGTWTLNGATVTFHFTSDGASGTGTLNGSSLTVGDVGFSLVYLRQ